MQEQLTQQEVDETCERLKKVWEEKVLESGKSEAMFIATDSTGFVANFLACYQDAKENVESLGLVMPEVVKGVTVRFNEE